ncbi:DUF721 domain-containing protein [Candidatus Dependentiae bacterium]|nr:DUF721 domain-containing protein [Candidatus Dependentiae bacterium]
MKKQLSDLLPLVFRHEHAWKIQLLQQWDVIFGNLSSFVQIEKIEHETLVLGVSNSCWLQELSLFSPLLLKTINEKLAHAPIKQLRFKLSGTKHRAKKSPTPSSYARCILSRTLNPAEQRALDHVHDQELRIALQRFLMRCSMDEKR